MKPSLVTIAIILSVIAIVTSLSQPLYNLYTSMNTSVPSVSGEPSFSIEDFSVGQFFTFFNLANNGTATAHDIKVRLMFYGSGASIPFVASTQFLPELEKGRQNVVSFEMPIGSFQLTYSGLNISIYRAAVYIGCKELSQTTESTFNL
jgi:hypothetical protein